MEKDGETQEINTLPLSGITETPKVYKRPWTEGQKQSTQLGDEIDN